MITEKIKVKGMHCKSCVILVEEAVAEVKGVESVKADLENEEVIIVFDGVNTTIEAAKKAIVKEGYKVE